MAKRHVRQAFLQRAFPNPNSLKPIRLQNLVDLAAGHSAPILHPRGLGKAFREDAEGRSFPDSSDRRDG